MRHLPRFLFLIGFLCASFGYANGSFAETAKWTVDPDHSTIGFQVPHMVVSKTNGKFNEYTGVVEMDPETQKFTTIEAVIHTVSLTTDHQKRVEHLRSPIFLTFRNSRP